MRGRLLILVGLVILLVVIVAVVFLSGGLPGTRPNTPATTPGVGQNVAQVPTAGPTPTPIRFVNIVVALQNLPRGYRFPTTIEELQNVVAYFPWP